MGAECDAYHHSRRRCASRAICCNVLVSGCDADHCRGNSTKPMLTKYLTAFLTTVSGNLVFRHRASKDPSWPLSLISTIAARTANSVAVKSSHSTSAMASSQARLIEGRNESVQLGARVNP